MLLKRRKLYMAAHLKVLRRFATKERGWAAVLAEWIALLTGEARNISTVSAWGTKCFCSDREVVVLASKWAGHAPQITLENFYPRTLSQRRPRKAKSG